MNKPEKISVSSAEVSCDGGAGSAGHPKVYLRIEQGDNSISCPYCSRTYVLQLKIKNNLSNHPA